LKYAALPAIRVHGASHGRSILSQNPEAQAPGAVPSVHFSTCSLPPAQQFEAYRADAIGFAELLQPKPGAGCAAHYTAWSLGPVVVKVTTSPALNQRRSAAMARRDGLDHWLLTMPRRSALSLDLGGRQMAVGPTRPALLSADQPFFITRPGAEEDWLIVFVARDALPHAGLPAGLDITQPLATPIGRLLAAFLRDMALRLPEMTAEQAPTLRDATLALLRATLVPSADHREAARSPAQAVLRAHVRRLIRERLGSATLTPDRLWREAGVSRTTLYRVFEPSGGVAAVIQIERLEAAKRMLSNPMERRTIQRIAEAVGFFDPSTFSRSFRRRFGMPPSELRERAQTGAPAPSALPRGPARGFLDLVAELSH
jgi:AraC-like DNA-binding protein